MSAVDGNFDATEASLNVVSVGIPPQHVSQQQRASLEVQKGATYAHYNLESVSLGHISAYPIERTYSHIWAVALERRLSDDSGQAGEPESMRLPDENQPIHLPDENQAIRLPDENQPICLPDEDQSIRRPEEFDAFAHMRHRSFSELIPQDARYCFESDSSNSDLANGFEADMALSQLSSSLVLPITGLSPVNFISELMRSDLYVSTPPYVWPSSR